MATNYSNMGTDGAKWKAYHNEQARKSPQTAGGLDPQGGRTFAADGSYTDYGVGLDTELGIRDKYNAQAEARLRTTIGGGVGGSPSTPVTRTSGDIATKEQAGRDAAFARAKETSGRVAQSAMTAMRDSLSRRGITGGGYAEMRSAEALAPATDQLQDHARNQAMLDVNNLQHTGDLEYQGAIQQRGQDMQQQQALLALMKSGRLY